MNKIIKICTGPRCCEKGSQKLYEKISAEFPQSNIETTGCQDNCQNGPTVVVSTPEKWKEVHSKMDLEQTKKLIS